MLGIFIRTLVHILIFSFFISGHVQSSGFEEDFNDQQNPFICRQALPQDVTHLIYNLLSKKEWNLLRVLSKGMAHAIENYEPYKKSLLQDLVEASDKDKLSFSQIRHVLSTTIDKERDDVTRPFGKWPLRDLLKNEILQKIEKQGYLMLAVHSPLTKFCSINNNFKGSFLDSGPSPASSSARSSVPSDLYKILFDIPLPPNWPPKPRGIAFSQLLAVFPLKVYFRKETVEDRDGGKGRENFFDAQKEELVKKFEILRKEKRYFALGASDSTLADLQHKNFNIVVTSGQLSDNNAKESFEELLRNNPNHIVLLSLDRYTPLENYTLPSLITHLQLVVPEQQLYGKIPKNFCNNSENLTFLEMPGFHDFDRIKDNFFTGSKNLKAFNMLEGMSNVSSIGDNFLSFTGLTHFDSTGLRIESLGKNAFANCPHLKEINLSGFANLIKLPYGFLQNCPNLEFLDMSMLIKPAFFKDNICANCTQLKSIKLPKCVEYIGKNFLFNNISLESLETKGLQVRGIKENACKGCSSLKILDLSAFTSIREIYQGFFEGCSSLSEKDQKEIIHFIQKHKKYY